MSYIQETNSIRVPPSLSEDILFILDHSDNRTETYSGHLDWRLPPLSVQNLITPAWDAVAQVEDQKVADEARNILLIIEKTILIAQSKGVDLGHLPQLYAFDVQGGSILIEWIFDDFRVGFSIEPILSESSWYLVSTAKLGDISVARNIPQDEFAIHNLMLKLLAFVISHV